MDIEHFADTYLPIPLKTGIHLQRIGNKTATNVPHLVVHHSPTGYEWGYHGSGPADLALNIAEVMLKDMGWTGRRTECFDGDCFTLSWQLHQELKRDFVANVQREGGVIPYEDLKTWMQARVPQDAFVRIADHATLQAQPGAL